MVVGALGVLRQFLWGLLRFPDIHCVKYNGANFTIKSCVNPHKLAENSANCWGVLCLGEGGVLYIQRGQENVRNHTQVKLAATSLECKQAGTFQYTSVCVGGRFRLITRIKVLNRNLRDAKDGYSMLFVGFKLII